MINGELRDIFIYIYMRPLLLLFSVPFIISWSDYCIINMLMYIWYIKIVVVFHDVLFLYSRFPPAHVYTVICVCIYRDTCTHTQRDRGAQMMMVPSLSACQHVPSARPSSPLAVFGDHMKPSYLASPQTY